MAGGKTGLDHLSTTVSDALVLGPCVLKLPRLNCQEWPWQKQAFAQMAYFQILATSESLEFAYMGHWVFNHQLL